MKVFALYGGGYPSRKIYLVPANTAMGACRKWNRANPDDKRYSDSFEEISDDATGEYGYIDEHY